MKWIAGIVWALCCVALAAGQEANPKGRFEFIELRITSVTTGGRAVIDRGASDGLEVGDAVIFQPRDGGPAWAAILEVRDRTSLVRFNDPNAVPPAGTRGRARIPKSRLAEPEPPADAAPPTEQEAAEHPPWSNEDEDYKLGQPLLTRVESVPPEERASRISGRAWTSADVYVSTAEQTDGFYRGGVDVLWENPFGQGGRWHFDGELNHRHALAQNDGDESLTLSRLDRFSYAWGGTRYNANRWQAGRFLQYGMPEFGELDGFEWSHRLADGNRVGTSIGWMPEPDREHTTGRDFQVAGWYEWVQDEREELAFAAGYQKTFHGGAPDRDLIVARMHWLPLRGWNANASAFIDIYSAGDDAKGPGIGVTHANASLRRQFRTAGVNFTYAHQEFPEIDRNEFTPVLANQLADDHLDRLAATGWTRLRRDLQLSGHVAGWVDEDDVGTDGEVALTMNDALTQDDRAELAIFGTVGQFTKAHGARIGYGRSFGSGRWDLLYELADFRQNGFDSDNDDILQHRLRASHEIFTTSGWTFSWYAEGLRWSDEFGAVVGAFLQRSF